MIIKKIVLKDFRQYKGRQEIKFSTDKERNVTVILGLNTSGKTTIIEAFKWCLYDATTYRKRDLINMEIVHDLEVGNSAQVFVEITLIHGNTEYIIKRTQNYLKTPNDRVVLKESLLLVSYKDDSGNTKHVENNETENVINTILPAELSDYFFFDGERIGDIGSRSDIKNSVKGLMGLDVITEAKNRLDRRRKNSVINYFESRLDIGSDKNSKSINDDISSEQDKIEEYRQILENLKEELKYYNTELRQITEKIDANQSVKEEQNKRMDLEKSLERDQLRLTELNSRIRKDFASKSLDFFSIPLISKSINTLNETKEEVEGIAGMSAKAIDHIIDRGICICGNNLKKNKEAKEKIISEKKLLPPYHIGTMVNETKTSFKYIEDRGYKFKTDIILDFRRYVGLIGTIDEKEKLLAEMHKNLKENEDIGKLELKRNDYKDKIMELNNRKETTLINVGSSENKVETLKRKMRSLAMASTKNDQMYKCIKYSEVLFDFFEESYNSKEKIVKEALEKNVNEIFESIYHGKRYLRIDEDYRVSLDAKVSEEMIETDMSKGLEAVKNFSFVAGLVKIAKEKVQDAEDIATEEPYPLVMDAPFSNVDEIHISSISKVLPTVSEQVIWILMEKDWNYAKDSLIGKIGYIYDIEKVNNSETYSVLKGRDQYV